MKSMATKVSNIISTTTNRGTYNPATGIYTSPSGQGYSMAKPPPNTDIIFTSEKKKSQGSVSKGTSRLPVSSLKTPTASAEPQKTNQLETQRQKTKEYAQYLQQLARQKQYQQGTIYTGLTLKEEQDAGVNYSLKQAGISKQSYEDFLRQQELEKSGDIQGFSGTTLSPQQIKTQQFYEKIGLVEKAKPYGEYYKPVTPKGKEFIENLKTPITLNEYVKKESEQNIQPSYPPLDTGEISSVIDFTKEYEAYNTLLKTYVTYPISEVTTGITLTTTKKTPQELLDIASSINRPLARTETQVEREFRKGIIEGTIEDIKERPLDQLALLGVGYGLGIAFKGSSTLLSKVPTYGKYLAPTFKGAVIGGGIIGLETSGVALAQSVYSAQNPKESGKIFAKQIKDFTLLGYGFIKGEKGLDILKGEIATRGLSKLYVPQGEYPKAPVNKQLELFNKNVYEEISKKPVAFHTTSEKFWSEGIITPMEGQSELAGLYASTEVSTPFSRIKGSGSDLINSFKEFEKSVLEMIAPERNPAIAVLEPKGFREVEIGYSQIKQFKGQKYVKGRGYAYFKTPAMKGYLDLPLMKTEIESIARVDAGNFEATGKKFYTEIKGVKVPIDAFKYSEEEIATSNKKFQNEVIKEPKEFKPLEYSSYKSPSLSESIVIFNYSKVISSSIKSLQNSLKSSLRISSNNLKSSNAKSSNMRSSTIQDYSKSISSSINSSNASMVSSIKSSLSKTSISTIPSSSRLSTSNEPPITIIQSPIKYPREYPREKVKSKSKGYIVYGKEIKIGKFVKLNTSPVTRNRALDIGTYYVDNTLARTFKIKQEGFSSEVDQFLFIPIGYYQQRKNILREYKIKKRVPYSIGEQYIEKNKELLSSPFEKKQIKKFQKEAMKILR